MAELDNLKALLELLTTVLHPFQDSQNRQSQALVLTSEQMKRLVDMFQSEPTRQTIIDAIRDIVASQTDEIMPAIEQLRLAIAAAQTVHNDACVGRHTIQRERDDVRNKETIAAMKELVELLKKALVDEMKPAKTLVELWDRIKWELRLAYAVAILIAGIALWMWHTTPVIKAAAAAAGAHPGP